MRQTMKKLLALLCVMAILLGLTACHTSEKPEETEPAMQQQSTQPTDPEKTDTKPTDPEPTDPEPTEPKPTDPEPTEPKPTEPKPTESEPTEPDPEVEAMQALLDYKTGDFYYNCALTSEYATPKDVDICRLFYNGFRDEDDVATEAETAFFNSQWNPNWIHMDFQRLPVEKMDALLMKMFGISLEDTNRVGMESYIYLEETDCYYSGHNGANCVDITVQKVEHQDNGVIHVFYLRGYLQDERMVVTLKQEGDSYQIISNLPEAVYKEPEKLTALRIAEEKIRLYKRYKFIGIACEYGDLGYKDMSRFLTEEQKKEYYQYQYWILCCHTAEEVKAHIDKHFGENVKGGYSEDKLFTDDEGKLYVIVTPTDTLGYNDIKILEYTDTQIVATAQVSDLSETFAVATFTLQMIDGEFVVVSVTTENL